MSETGGITASSLAITEKKPQRTGGCVGIFFQLFDWNRRFAKKKLFSKKLLPPVRLKQGSKKFGGDEKQPKHRLIADENSGGFPNIIKSNSKGCSVYSEKKHEMRSPGLVARLMGLDSMPAVPKEKPKKVSFNESAGNKEEKFGCDTGGFEGEEQSFVKMGAKQELRPQKLQKTGLSERRPVTRFGAEALQIKSMLSRSRKHHPKLATPLKSSRNVAGRNASRLIGVASKILEPGMQKSRGKYALPCSDTLRRPSAVLQEHPMSSTPGNSEFSSYYTGTANALKGTSCQHCGHSLDILDSIPSQEEEPSIIPSPVSNCIEHCQDSESSKPRVPIFYSQEQKERAHQGPLYSAAVEEELCSAGGRFEKNPVNRGQMPQQLTSQECQPSHGSSHGHVHRTQKPNQMFPGRDRVPQRARSSSLQSNRVTSAANSVNETKNFVALNKALNGSSTRMRMPTKSDSCAFESERRFCNRRTESLSPVRKRRSVNVTRQGESSEFTNFNLGKGLSGSSNSMSGKETVHPVRSMNRAYTDRKSPYPQETGQNGSRQKVNDIVSFTFKSPVKQKAEVQGEAIGRRFQTNSCSDRTPGKLELKENNGSICSEEPPFALRGDTLGAILEQKLKELTCQEVELAQGGTTSRKTTAVILQELISALTAERQFHEDDFIVRSNGKSDISHPESTHHYYSPTKFQATAKSATTPAAYNRDINHFSPGSVLEGSFSNNSYVSSSLDGNSISGDKVIADSLYFCDESCSFNPDADLLDSATSLATGKCYRTLVSDLVNNITAVLQKINLFNGDLRGSKLDYAKEILLNAELVLGDASWSSSSLDTGFSVTQFLLEELETLASVMLMRFDDLLGLENAKHGSQLKQFIFDCVLEVVDSKLSRYSKSGFGAWTKLPPCMNTEILLFEILGEVKLWMAMTGLIHDDKIEWDMSHSLGKWTDFEVEVFENGVEIDRQILQNLVDEVVMDFCTVL
nr:Futsch light chain LC(F) like [Ipomoea batatas]